MKTWLILGLFSFPFWAKGQISGSITQGSGTTIIANLMPNCLSNHVTPLGTITSTDNKIWKVPAETQFLTGSFASDLFNSCNNKTPSNLSAADLSSVPIKEIDANGDLITGFLFSDNYFEFYVNGMLVGVDPVPFTPFNSCVVKFRVSKPYTLAVKLVDWEENPGLGTEIQGANNFHPGDGGFIAQFSDGTVTNANWKAQTFYIAPIQDLNAVQELPDGTRSTASATGSPTCNANCYGVHYEEPLDWKNENFNDLGWPGAKLYTAAQVTNQPAYTNFANSAWNNASFIWSSNLILDNVVLARYTVPALTSTQMARNSKRQIRWISDTKTLEIDWKENYDGNGAISISDLYGRAFQPKPKGDFSLDLSQCPSGLYFLKFQKGNQCETHKILIP